jgi:NAD(P)-dependent dehydrogenase (short-subunit alcohol dehydrogenase family)
MEFFAGRLAVVTGGGSGIGRALVRQLAREGASVAVLDLHPETAEETAALARAEAPEGVRVTAHAVNVVDEAALVSTRAAIVAAHGRDDVNLLFNNAGIAGAGSMLVDDRAAWERVFDICWRGVYLGCRVFLPSLVASEEGYIVNTASINAVWPTHGRGMPSTAYGSAKYAVKGLSEALVEDLRTHAPHVRVAVVMPGGVGTNIGANSSKILGGGSIVRAAADGRELLRGMGAPVDILSDDEVAAVLDRLPSAMTELGYVLPVEEAAAIILRGVHEGRWRILVGIGADRLDRLVRENPEGALDLDGTPPWLATLVTLGIRLDPSAVAPGSYGFAIDGDHPAGITIDADGVRFRADPDPVATATVTLDSATLHRLVRGDAGPAAEIASGRLLVAGDGTAVERLFGASPLP